MILALDLTTPRGALAVVDDGGDAVFDDNFRAHRSHNALVFEPLNRALSVCGTSGPRAMVVGTGPGSYTGVRVAISAGTGIAMALGIPLIGLPSASAADRGGEVPAPFLLVGDARREKFFGAEVDPLENFRDFGADLFDASGITDWVSCRSDKEIWTFDARPPGPVSKARLTFPNPVLLGRMVAGLNDDRLSAIASPVLEPLYLSAPFVTVPKSR